MAFYNKLNFKIKKKKYSIHILVTDNEFLRQTPTDIHLRRLSMQYSIHETKELAIHLGMDYNTWERMYDTLGEEPERLNFEILHRCIESFPITFDDIKKAVEIGNIKNPHILCKVSWV